jgi:hypothetical protein
MAARRFGRLVLLLLLLVTLCCVAVAHGTALSLADNSPACAGPRAALKRLADASGAGFVPGPGVPVTVDGLLSVPAPAALPPNSRVLPDELKVVRVDALLISARLETDGSIRILIGDPYADGSAPAFVVELPDSTQCGDAAGPAATAMAQARSRFITDFGLPASDADTPLWRYAQITGVQFFVDPLSAESVAANGLELAPLLDFQLVGLDTPVTMGALANAVTSYRAQVNEGLQLLAVDTDQLQAAVDQGQLDLARTLWLPAHLDYERLGAAYGTFGDYDREINWRPDGLPNGAADPQFRGFHRLEYGLWSGQTAAELRPVANQLDTDVHALVATFPDQTTDPLDLPLRAHEILENALQFELTGQTDEGSHSNLATVRANVDGTRMALSALQPMLEPRATHLWQTIGNELDGFGAELGTYQQPDGSWPGLQQLDRAQRERLNGSLGQLLEDLADVPDVLELTPPGQ